jgi:predicted PurR-regulated permease PerM/uncharacterized tellurite resistance protein B-like protein
MSLSKLFSNSLNGAKTFFRKPVNKAIDTLSGVIENASDKNNDKDALAKEIVSLISAVAWADGEIHEEETEQLKNFLNKSFSNEKTEQLLEYFKQNSCQDIDEAASKLLDLSEEERISILAALIDIALSNRDYSQEQRQIIKKISEKLQINSVILSELEEQSIETSKRRDSIFKSSAGIIVALLIIIIFILTATFLKAVLFGLILAYLFLPLEKWFENKFFKSNTIRYISGILSSIFSPGLNFLRKIKKTFTRKELEESPEDKEKKEKEAVAGRACAATVGTCAVAGLLIVFFFFYISATYVSGIKNSVERWSKENSIIEKNDTNEATEKNTSDSFFNGILAKLESHKPKLEKIPFFKWAVNKAKDYLKDEKNREELVKMLLSRSGGVFSYTAGFLGTFMSALLNILLSFFFFSLFLQKIAISTTETKKKVTGGSIVGGVMDSKWMPHISYKTKADAAEIISNIIIKLRAWVRGYFSIIFIESIIYITLFMLLGVPYAPILGFLAGCTVLLPYIGPVSSAMLTIIVCFAAGSPSMLLIILIILCYMIMNGVVEQLFLYPSLVGNALGLTTIETIVVVLLGGLFAGLSGMIFAVPAAAVLKYLVPKIYTCWN